MAKLTTKENLIEVGLKLMRSTGYTATGINQVLESAGVPKGSFYHHFATKDDFVKEVLQRYSAHEFERVDRVLNTTGSPLKRLRKYFREMITYNGRKSGPISGCLLGNLSLEMAGQNQEIRDLLQEAFNGWQAAIAKTLREAVNSQELPKTARIDDLAALIINGWEGAQVRAKTEQSDKPLELFFDNTFNLLLKN
jgi:TetR/AcrR family transcriptional regulator, transcriptional repressor for nem operon